MIKLTQKGLQCTAFHKRCTRFLEESVISRTASPSVLSKGLINTKNNYK